jgi:polysaccharide biosynthesis protein PslH
MASVELLKQAGWDVHYAYLSISGEATVAMQSFWANALTVLPYRHPSVSGDSEQRWRARIRKWLPPGNYALKQNASLDDWFDFGIEARFRTLIEQLSPDVVICHYVWLSKVLEWVPEGIVKIIDTHDRFTDRYRVAAAAGKPNDWYSTWSADEQRGLQRADRILAISEDDQAFFTKIWGIPSVYHPPFMPVRERTCPTGNGILFVGNANAANVRAVEWFLKHCWPGIVEELPDARLHIAGSVCEHLVPTLNVRHWGRVDDLTPLYQACKVAINPVPSGSGVAIKCLEAFSHHRPVVATPEGSRGLSAFVGACLLSCESPAEFTASVIGLFQDPDCWDRASNACSSLLEQWNQISRDNLLFATDTLRL